MVGLGLFLDSRIKAVYQMPLLDFKGTVYHGGLDLGLGGQTALSIVIGRGTMVSN